MSKPRYPNAPSSRQLGLAAVSSASRIPSMMPPTHVEGARLRRRTAHGSAAIGQRRGHDDQQRHPGAGELVGTGYGPISSTAAMMMTAPLIRGGEEEQGARAADDPRGRGAGQTDQPAADREPADAAAGQQRARRHRGPRERPRIPAGNTIEESAEQHDEADAREQLQRDGRDDPARAHLSDLVRNRLQPGHRDQQRHDQRAQQHRGRESLSDPRTLVRDPRPSCPRGAVGSGRSWSRSSPKSFADRYSIDTPQYIIA